MDHMLVLSSGFVSNFNLSGILTTMKFRVIVGDFSDVLWGLIEVIDDCRTYESHLLVVTLALVLFDVLPIAFSNGKTHSIISFCS